ncbi:MAG TPA: DUF4864 domain-containing protein [Burkholderiales bacterium]
MLRPLILALALILPGLAAAAESLSASDVAEIRAVINRQIDAFRRDDARGAFALVSPGVQQEFGTPERFLDVVRGSYRAVYRPATVNFLEVVAIGGEAVQPVQLTDRSGAVWLAYYAMQRQHDGSWRASGCHLVQPAKTIQT